MVDFVLGRLKFTYQGNWATSTAYIKDDIVTYGGRTYVCTSNHTSSSNASGGFYTDSSYWTLIADGFSFKNTWASSTYYKVNDIVRVDGYVWICTTGHTSAASFHLDESDWSVFVPGLMMENTWSSGTQYYPGDIVGYGGYTYVCIQDSLNNTPSTATSYWTLLTTGYNTRGSWSNSTSYKVGDVVTYGAYSYVSILDNSNVIPGSNTTSNWQQVSSGSQYIGTWSSSTNYKKGDQATYSGSTYISIWDDSNSNNYNYTPSPSGPNTAYWSLVSQGAANTVLTTTGDLLFQDTSGLNRLAIGSNNQILTVNSSGKPAWANSGFANAVYYVTPSGSDNNNGTSMQSAFATIQKAAQTAPNNATIFIKNGTYSEVLPIVVPGGVSIVGDSQRGVIVQPANSTYSIQTMWQLSDATLLKSMTFKGMTGWVGNTGSPSDITLTTPVGVFVAFNPTSPITTKSPYIFECSAISTRGIGAYVDGSAHASGNKSMLFHAYTQINDDGVGYYVNNGGRAEIVSCFTYYCWFGFATANGGYIRGLNNNNSYGKYGSSSYGYDSTEVTANGTLTGNMLTLSNVSTTTFSTGEYIAGSISGANGYVFSFQQGANTLYYKTISGTFANNDVITGSVSAANATIANTGNGQNGYVLVANGFTALPDTGGAIVFNSGDTGNAYIIQSVSGSYVNTSSNLVFVLANQKTYPSPQANTFKIRYKYSQIRLMGHDFLNIGTGNTVTTNYPGVPSVSPVQSQQINENLPGRVFYVATDQSGNFYVGKYFSVQQATGIATLNASAFNLSGLSTLRLGAIGAQLGETINEFSSDSTLSSNSVSKVPTQSAVTVYVGNQFTNRGYSSYSISFGNSTVNAAITNTSIRVGNSTINTVINTTAFSTSANATFTGTMTVQQTLETTTVSGTNATGTINYDALTQSVLYYTGVSTGTFTLNVRGNSGTTLNSVMAIGQSLTVVFVTAQNSSSYYSSALNIDGVSQTIKWSGGSAPSTGGTSGFDAYTFTIIKTASATYTVLGTQSKFY